MVEKISELVRLPEFAGLPGEYERVCAAYVHKFEGRNTEILIGNRRNDKDPLRKDYLVLPCGHLEDGESFKDAVLRETKEETGVDATIGNPYAFSTIALAPYLKEYGPVVTVIDKEGMIWIFSRDSGRRLSGRAFDLYPCSEPHETNSDLKNPRYVSFKQLFEERESVMPEEGLVLDLIEEYEFSKNIKNRVLLDEKDFSGFMREAILS